MGQNTGKSYTYLRRIHYSEYINSLCNLIKRQSKFFNWKKDLDSYSSRQDKQMASKYRKRCSLSLVSRGMETQITMRYHLTSYKMVQEIKNNNSLQGCWENTAGGNINIKDILEQSLAVPHSIKHGYHVAQQFHLAVDQREVKTQTYKTLCITTDRTIIYKSQKVEITRMTMKRWLETHMLAYPCNRIVFSDKNEWIADMCHINEPWKDYTAKRIQIQRAIYCMVPFTWNAYYKQIYRDTW